MHRIKKTTSGLLLAMASLQLAAAPPTIVAQGRGAAAACISCHGADGAGNAQAGYPALAGLPTAYFTKQIADFKSGTRTNAIMTPIARALSVDDTEAAARYYAGLPRIKAVAVTMDPAMLAQGKSLAVNGAWGREMPACFKCHGVDGRGVAPVFPPLAGQHATYTLSQLQAWKAGTRQNDPLHLMKTVADKLSDAEMQALATYLSTLGTGEKAK